MDSLRETLRQMMSGYTGEALNGYSYLTHDQEQNLFTVVSVGHIGERRIIDTGLVVRLDGNTIIIEHDANDKPLVDALLEIGVPRSQIILAYAGETPQQAELA